MTEMTAAGARLTDTAEGRYDVARTGEDQDLRRFPAAELTRLASSGLAALGTPPEIAGQVARSLVLSNLVGHDSHGIIRLDQYSALIADGQVKATAEAAVTRRQQGAAVVTGAWGFGQPAAQMATSLAIELSREFSVAAVTITDCNHIGRLGEYAAMLADAGLAGLAYCNAGPVVAPFGGTGRALGTNPFAWAAPGGPDGPLVVDFSTAGVAEGKLRVAAAEGRTVGEGLIVDAAGRPTTQPDDFFAGGALLPFGGHKGSGLSVMIELLGGLLTGMGTAPSPDYAGGNGTVLMAMNIAAFTDPAAYQAGAADFCTRLTAAGAGPTGGQVLLPGQVEARTRREREEHGVPVGQGVLELIYRVTDPLGLARLTAR
jgi:LDH2 family malate/lactate/ureidoglycolate dehydrogenase